ncbi:MAG: PHP domain-containing protein [Chloroflexi bacterium]|nr:PHP domain-containing protein [Chloroflexota bacterium]
MSVFDLHVHTVRGSSDSSLTPEQLVKRAREIGLDGICLTEHSGGWDDQKLQEAFQDSGITVVGGLEVETEMGHVLVFGLHSYTSGINKIDRLRRAVDRAGGVMVSAHPFRNLFNPPPHNVNLVFRSVNGRPGTADEATGHPLFQVVDEIEAANGSNTDRENDFALDVAHLLGFVGTGGSDAHSDQGLGRCVTVFDGDVRSEADLIEALRAKAFKPAQGLHVGQLQSLGG